MVLRVLSLVFTLHYSELVREMTPTAEEVHLQRSGLLVVRPAQVMQQLGELPTDAFETNGLFE